MRNSNASPGKRGRALPAPYVPAIFALVVLLILGIFAESQNKSVRIHDQRNEVRTDLDVIHARLESSLNGIIQLIQGLASALSAEGEIHRDRFSQLVDILLRDSTGTRGIAKAGDVLVSLTYRRHEAEFVIGRPTLPDSEGLSAAERRAWSTGKAVLTEPSGPSEGGGTITVHIPVSDKNGNGRSVKGLISAVIHLDHLFTRTGLLDPTLSLEVALQDTTLAGRPMPLLGSIDALGPEPVITRMWLPSGRNWRVAARPKDGWGIAPSDLWIFRLIVLVAGLLAVAPLLISARLAEERRRHLEELRRREIDRERLAQRLELAIDVSQLGVWHCDLESRQISWDRRVNEIYGFAEDDAIVSFERWIASVHPEDADRAQAQFNDAIEGRTRYSSEYRIILPDGRVRHIRSRGAVYEDGEGSHKMLGAEWDVTSDFALNRALEHAKTLAERRNVELETAKARIERDALHDALTGLPNRRFLDEILQRAKDANQPAAILHVDLDRFKQINDTLGHAAGDAMLVHASSVLQDSIGSQGIVARIGGDEFVLLCTSGESDFLSSLARRIIDKMRQPVIHEGHECRFGVSVGIASAAGTGLDLKRLLVNADIALYRAKRSGRNRYEFFTEELQAEIVRTKRIADEILSGLERAEFVNHYQPQFDADTLDIIGVEALVRWQHPTRGIQLPNYFLKVAEELNVVAAIDRIVLDQALIHSALWMSRQVQIPRVSVNVSAKRLRDEELIDSLRGLAIRPGTVSFELVESIFLDEGDDKVARNIEQIKTIGFDIEIDDFGSGHASIISLLKLKPRRLKIDRELVRPIVGSAAQRQLVASIIEIGKTLGVEVIAEGVETLAHARILRDLGCRGLQGFAFAGAMPAPALAQFVRQDQWRAVS